MRYTKVTLLVQSPDESSWDCGCDQTFSLAYLHQLDKGQYVIDHDRGTLDEEVASKKMYSVFTKEGGI